MPGTGYDLWGESIPDSSGLYSANTFLADGADLFVYSLDSTGAARWTQNKQRSTKYSADQDGALLLSNNILFYLLRLSNGAEIWHGSVVSAAGGVQNPVIVNDPTRGPVVYVTDGRGVIALIPG